MHGDREQEEREKALSDLKSGRVRVLLATDVAARGIDVIDITYVPLICLLISWTRFSSIFVLNQLKVQLFFIGIHIVNQL